jgi:Cys-tRNA(Pro)/Cys-tRNA(Cys) deacylase
MAKAKEKENKTNACRLLEQAHISFRTMEYEVDETDLSGEHAAKVLGMNPEMLFKTLVARNDKNQLMVFCIPVLEELDLKKAAKASNSKKVEMIHVRELLDLTGYIRGGCSPVGMKKQYPTWIDETCMLFDEIGISAGKRGCQLLINPENLISYVGMRVTDLTK